MRILHAIKSLCGCVGHMIQETYSTLGQKVAERFEDASDAIAEQRYLAKKQAESPASGSLASQPLIEVKGHRVINGFKHTA